MMRAMAQSIAQSTHPREHAGSINSVISAINASSFVLIMFSRIFPI
jgi:hypothetical protein